jgi:hypothetical protein
VSTDAAAPPLNLPDVTIGILTALEEEYAACLGIFDPGKNGREEQKHATSGSFTCWLCSIKARNGGYPVGFVARWYSIQEFLETDKSMQGEEVLLARS